MPDVDHFLTTYDDVVQPLTLSAAIDFTEELISGLEIRLEALRSDLARARRYTSQ